MSIANTKPAWTKGDLRRLGEALVAGRRTPEVQARYDEVMLWHNDLAAEVAATLYTTNWQACSPDLFDITARPKTLDTLLQKLRRERNMTLDDVQDLAGVRIDADITLDVQTALAHEIEAHFGEHSRVRDLRDNPHSGYRAVHVWLRLPAGRVEVQIRTVAQSTWANTYERLGDLLGRGIRYDEMPEHEGGREVVEMMHRMSDALARGERAKLAVAKVHHELQVARNAIDVLPKRARWSHPIQHGRTLARLKKVTRQAENTQAERDSYQAQYLEMLNDIRSTLDDMGQD